METETRLTKYFHLHEHSLWLLSDRQIARSLDLESVCGATYVFKPWITKQ
jgi:hypothetical protein